MLLNDNGSPRQGAIRGINSREMVALINNELRGTRLDQINTRRMFEN